MTSALIFGESIAWLGGAATFCAGVLAFAAAVWINVSDRKERRDERRRDRADMVADRARAERKEAYAVLLKCAEDSMHKFEWVEKGVFTEDEHERDLEKADVFYDQEVSVRYQVLKMIGTPAVVTAAREMRRPLRDIRGMMVSQANAPTSEGIGRDSRRAGKFDALHARYRTARDEFARAASIDLGLADEDRDRLHSPAEG